jgi:hypothetical protein
MLSRQLIKKSALILTRAVALVTAVLLGGCNHSERLAELKASIETERAQAEARLQSISHIRLDAPLTQDNSVPLAFEDGPTLRVPKILFDPESLSKDPKQVFQTRALSLTFWYPDMTVTSLQSPSIPHKGTPGYVPQTDRFWVWVNYMWYVRPDSDSLVPGSTQPDFKFAPRPPRIAINLWCSASKNGRCDEMTRLDSGIVGIDRAVSTRWIVQNPGAEPPTKNGAVYVARSESPYELYMSCSGLDCDATVYSKSHHFEYRMYFPSEAAGRTDALIRIIDKMLDAWPMVSYPPH